MPGSHSPLGKIHILNPQKMETWMEDDDVPLVKVVWFFRRFKTFIFLGRVCSETSCRQFVWSFNLERDLSWEKTSWNGKMMCSIHTVVIRYIYILHMIAYASISCGIRLWLISTKWHVENIPASTYLKTSKHTCSYLRFQHHGPFTSLTYVRERSCWWSKWEEKKAQTLHSEILVG